MSENFIPMYNIESLTEPQRVEYVKALCQKLGIPDNLNLVALTSLDDGEGPSRLVAYIKRGGAESIRNSLKLDVKSLTNQMVGGSIVFTAVGIDKTGRQEIAVGSKYIEGLTGSLLDDSVMTASTRALRRLAIQFTGTGILDESEVNQRKTVHVTSSPAVAPAPQPTVAPSSEPGKDITPLAPELAAATTASSTISGEEQRKRQGQFEAEQAKLRADAIAQLNAKHSAAQNPPKEGVSLQTSAEPVKKTRKPRGPNKPKVDLGPSEPVPTKPVYIPPASVAAAIIDPLPGPEIILALKAPEPSVSVPVKPRLTPDQVKPFRQRLFRIVNDYLEPNGFTPKEGMGNADKMRSFATMMFPEVTNMNELTIEQWERYLTTLENKVKAEGPVATVKYIEETIGL